MQSVLLRDVERFAWYGSGIRLRAYQREVARAITASVIGRQGLSFAVLMSRQSGKNELSALIEAYLLQVYRRQGGQIVKASPTYRPQTLNSKLRLLERWAGWERARMREGYILEVGRARCLFLSAAPAANVVGATASLLLECDEAQSVDAAKWLRDFAPMAASTNATTVYWGTAWTDRTLLAQMTRALRGQEACDGVRRVFIYDADHVAAEVPAYGRYVAEQVARFGRQHPLIRSQYYLEEVESAGGLFPAARQAQMRGDHPRQTSPTPGKVYALLVDVGGAATSTEDGGRWTEDDGPRTEVRGMEDSSSVVRLPSSVSAAEGRRDATALTIVEINTATVGDPLIRLPSYSVVDRRLWRGAAHPGLYAQLLDLARLWDAAYAVVDATGLGSGLAQFLARALGPRLIPVTLNSATKSRLGWRFLGLVDTGRFKDYADDGAADTRQFWYEVGACEFDASGQGGLRWGVWETPRHDGLVARGHDDLLLSAALCVYLDDARAWGYLPGAVSEAPDPLDEVDNGGF